MLLVNYKLERRIKYVPNKGLGWKITMTDLEGNAIMTDVMTYDEKRENQRQAFLLGYHCEGKPEHQNRNEREVMDSRVKELLERLQKVIKEIKFCDMVSPECDTYYIQKHLGIKEMCEDCMDWVLELFPAEEDC